MADTQQEEVTAEQVKTANEMEMAKWENDFPEDQLKVSYKAEDAKDDKVQEETTDEPDEEVEEFEEPVSNVTATDPGEYRAADYSFTAVNKDGKTVTIKTPDEADTFAEDDENFKSAKALKDFLRLSQRMENNLEQDHKNWENQTRDFQEQSALAKSQIDTVNNFANEFEYLIDKGLLPKVAQEYKDADWSDPEVRKQPGVKEQSALLSYFVKENKVRESKGISPLSSIVDAYNSYQLDESRKNKEKATKAAGEARKAASSRIAGVSPSPVSASNIPKGIAVGNKNVLKRNAAVWDN